MKAFFTTIYMPTQSLWKIILTTTDGRADSDILIEEAMQKAQVDTARRYNGEHNKLVSRFIIHPKLNNPILRPKNR